MNSFQYISTTQPKDAIAAIGKQGRYLGGGIDLLGEMKDYIVSPDILVALRDPVPGQPHSVQRASDGSLVLSGAMTMAEIAANADLQAAAPGLAQAAGEVGSPQIRNVATLAGNLLQHSRCWYYRQPDVVCLKRGGTTCYAREGENKYLALFSGCECISPIVSNTAIALAALDARVTFYNPGNGHPMGMHELYRQAWSHPQAHNSVKPEDFLVSVQVPDRRLQSAYRQASERREFDWALVSCAAAGNVKGGTIRDPRVALGAISPVPHMVEAAHAFLEGKPLTEATVSHAADLILKDAKPLAQNGYKIPLAHTLIRRTLLALNA
jgi:xanthine dehydrogenase YagS FAD-binding subunit